MQQLLRRIARGVAQGEMCKSMLFLACYKNRSTINRFNLKCEIFYLVREWNWVLEVTNKTWQQESIE